MATIKGLEEFKDNAPIEVTAVASCVEILQKRGSTPGDYIRLTIQDQTGILIFPIWDDIDILKETLVEGEIYTVWGIKSSWNNTVQIKNIVIKKIDKSKFTDEQLEAIMPKTPSYDITDHHIDKLIGIIDDLDEPYRTFARYAIIEKEGMWEKFITSVSAEKHHGNKRGGLLLHTVGVVLNIYSMIHNYVSYPIIDEYDASDVINVNRLVLKGLVHDIKKIDEYDSKLIKRIPGKKLGHIEEGVAFIYEVNRDLNNILSDEEIDNICYSILSHHGQYGKYEPKSLEDKLLHMADMIDSSIVGEVEKNQN